MTQLIQLNHIYNQDCLIGMQSMPSDSIDLILADLPYSVTDLSWDTIIPFDKLWEQYERIIKVTGAIVLFGTEPFSSLLRTSNLKLFKYDWIWEKGRASGFVHAKNKPLKAHEIISVFSKGTTVHANQSKNRMKYFPQMSEGDPYTKKITQPNSGKINHDPSTANKNFVGTINNNSGTRYPRSILKYSMHNVGNIHPTQKPLSLCEYLIKTYTLEQDVVLDNVMGSGTTICAAIRTNRNYIGFELTKEYFDLAKFRIDEELLRRDNNV